IERFESKEALVQEQLAPARAIKPSGTIIVFDQAITIQEHLKKMSRNVVYYGETNQSQIVLNNYQITYNQEKQPLGISFRVDVSGSSVPVMIKNTLGKSHAYAVTASLAVASTLDMNIVSLLDVFENYIPTLGRLHLILGIKNTLII